MTQASTSTLALRRFRASEQDPRALGGFSESLAQSPSAPSVNNSTWYRTRSGVSARPSIRRARYPSGASPDRAVEGNVLLSCARFWGTGRTVGAGSVVGDSPLDVLIHRHFQPAGSKRASARSTSRVARKLCASQEDRGVSLGSTSRGRRSDFSSRKIVNPCRSRSSLTAPG